MKKIIAVFVSFMFVLGCAFAQDSASSAETSTTDDSMVRVIVPEDQHTVEKSAQVRIEYTAMYDEVRIYYTCLDVSYEQGEAMNTILACLQDFQKENQYFSYKYLDKDKVRYYKDEKGVKMAQYFSYVKFYR